MPIVKRVETKTAKSFKDVKEGFTSDLTLPSAPSKPMVRLEDYSVLLYGDKKIGKTTMLSYAGEDTPGKKVFFMMCEPGGKALNIYQRPVKNWRDFKGYVSLVCKSKEFGSVVIDTADYAYEMCMDHVCREMGVEHPSDEGWGKGWKKVKNEFTREVKRLLDSGLGVFFTSHSRDREVKSRLGVTYHKTEPSLSNQAKEVLEGIVDIWIYYAYDNGKRILQLEGDDNILAGHRLGEPPFSRFKYSDGTPIKRIESGVNAKDTFHKLREAFECRLKKGGTEQAVVVAKKKFIVK